MKLPKIFFRKLIIGAVLLAIATGMTAFIKESLDTQDPESALPIITVLYGDEELVPDKEVRRAGWEWNFFLTQEKTPLLSPEDVPLQPVDVMPGAQMRILFTKEPSELRVMRAVSDKPTEYLELSDAGGGRFSTPTTPGLYFYKVRAEWSGRGFIQYYFALQVREWHAILMCREPSAHVRLRGTILFCACPGRAAASQRPRPACR